MEKRCRSLQEYLAYEGAPEAVRVVCGRAEELARDPELEGSSELLVMRSFGPPSPAAECAVRFVSTGGLIIVSEPPVEDSELRWDAAGLATLGLHLLGVVTTSHRFVVIEKDAETPELYPRRNGLPTKRPLWA
jgi:16S rRNA (guanine527-N7)-methyltransferase